jgi:iron complex outermembrane receptor protein
MANRSGFDKARATVVACAPPLASCVLALWSLVPPVRAAGRDLTELTLEELSAVVVTASKHEQATCDAPASVTVLTAGDIAAFGWSTLSDALRSVVGLHLADDRNYLAAGARGFVVPGDYSLRVLLLVDGHRVNEPIYHSPDFEHITPVPMSAVERIEVVRGPGSALYGSDAIFAVINVITRDGAAAPRLRLHGRLGTQRTWDLGATAGHAWRSGWDVAVAAEAHGSAGDGVVRSPGLPPARDADGLSAVDLFGRAGRAGWTFTWAASSRRKDIPTASYGTVAGPGSFTIDGRSWLEARWARSYRNDHALSVRTGLDGYMYSGHYLYDVSEEQDGSELAASRDSADALWSRTEVEWSAPVGRRTRVTAGADVEHAFVLEQRYWEEGEDPLLDVESPTTTYGLLAQGEIEISSRARLVLGARTSHLGGAGRTFNHREALIVRAGPRTTVKVMHGTAFRAPTPYEMFYQGNPQLPNPKGLAGEAVATSEVALLQALPHGIELEVSAFANRLDDVIESAPLDGGSTQFQNAGNARARGVEWALHGRLPRGWQLRLGGAHQRAEDEDGTRLVGSPDTILDAAFVAPLGSRTRSTLAVETRWMGPARTHGDGSTGSGLLASLHWRWPGAFRVDGLEVLARVTNLLDDDAPIAAGPEHAQDVIPAARRRVTFGLAYTF